MCAKDFVGRMDWQIQRGAEAQASAKTSLAKTEFSSPLSLLCFKANSSEPYGMSDISRVILESFSSVSQCSTQGVQVAFDVVCDAFNAQGNTPCSFIFPCPPASPQPWGSQEWNRENK